MQKVYPHAYKTWNESLFEQNRKFILNNIFPTKMLNIHYVDKSRSEIILSIENYGKFPVEVSRLKLASGRVLGAPLERTIVSAQEKLSVVFKVNKDFQRLFVSKKQGKLKFNTSKDITKFKVVYQTLDTSRIREEKILPWSAKNQGILETDVFKRTVDNKKRFPWLMYNEDEKIITCSQCTHHS